MDIIEQHMRRVTSDIGNARNSRDRDMSGE